MKRPILMGLVAVLSLCSASATSSDEDGITATLSSTSSGETWWDDPDGLGWQVVRTKVAASIKLKGRFVGKEDAVCVYELYRKEGFLNLDTTAEDVFLGETWNYRSMDSMSVDLQTRSGLLKYDPTKNRVTYAGFSLEVANPKEFRPYHVRYFDDGQAGEPFVRIFLQLTQKWALPDHCDVRGTTTVKAFMLSFDDGPLPDKTDRLLGVLRTIQVQGEPVKAAFFMVGSNDASYHASGLFEELWHEKGSVREYPEIARAVARAGHVIGNHTQHHANFSPDQALYKTKGYAANGDFIQAEIGECEQELSRALGTAPARLFRPPYLENNAELTEAVAALGYKIVMGRTVGDFLPWPTFAFVSMVKGNARTVLRNWDQPNPCVLIFHDIFPETCEHLDEVVRYLRENDYTLIHFDPGQASGSVSTPGGTPTLTIQPLSSGKFLLSWPASSDGKRVSLQSTDDPSDLGSWQPETSPLTVVEDYYAFLVGASESRRFYRVRVQEP